MGILHSYEYVFRHKKEQLLYRLLIYFATAPFLLITYEDSLKDYFLFRYLTHFHPSWILDKSL